MSSKKSFKNLKSSWLHQNFPQPSALRYGMGFSEASLRKPHLLVVDFAGDSHPGSYHLHRLAEAAGKGILQAGGTPFHYHITDLCDGISQGHEGMNYSLPSRDFMAAMIEAYVKSGCYDGLILIASCDKSLPASLIAAARLNIPAIIIPGGSMDLGPDYLMQGQVSEYFLKIAKTQDHIDYQFACQYSCPSGGGACQFLGTASTMQILTEALGMSLPYSALLAAESAEILVRAESAGKEIMQLIKEDLTPRDILTLDNFHNAVTILAAIGGSTNAILHLLAIASEAKVDLKLAYFDEINRSIPYMSNFHTAGPYPARWFLYAGGLARLNTDLNDFLQQDIICCENQNFGNRYLDYQNSLRQRAYEGFLANYKVKPAEIILPFQEALERSQKHGLMGSFCILYGDLAPSGSVVKHISLAPEMFTHQGSAKVYDSEEAAFQNIMDGKISPGDVIVVRYEGPKASGMPELYLTSLAISSHPELRKSVALVTDARFSGATQGPAVGHVTPEAFIDGSKTPVVPPLALIENEDILQIDLPNRRIDLIGIKGQNACGATAKKIIKKILQDRQTNFTFPQLKRKYQTGMLGIYTSCAIDASHGAYMSGNTADIKDFHKR